MAQHLAERSLEEIEEAYPSYSRAELLSALAYYYDHKDKMDRLIDGHRRSMEEWRAESEAIQGPSKARELLKARTPRT